MTRDMEEKKKKNREIVMQERQCFVYEGFGHITCHYRNMGEK